MSTPSLPSSRLCLMLGKWTMHYRCACSAPLHCAPQGSKCCLPLIVLRTYVLSASNTLHGCICIQMPACIPILVHSYTCVSLYLCVHPYVHMCMSVTLLHTSIMPTCQHCFLHAWQPEWHPQMTDTCTNACFGNANSYMLSGPANDGSSQL